MTFRYGRPGFSSLGFVAISGRGSEDLTAEVTVVGAGQKIGGAWPTSESLASLPTCSKTEPEKLTSCRKIGRTRLGSKITSVSASYSQ